MFENPIEYLISQVKVMSQHVDYAPSGRGVASLQFNGEPALVRQLLDRIAELSENGQLQRGAIDLAPGLSDRQSP